MPCMLTRDKNGPCLEFKPCPIRLVGYTDYQPLETSFSPNITLTTW